MMTPKRHATRVLVVDDHPLVRAGVVAAIRRERDFAVCGQAEGLTTALAVAAQTRPDLAVVDLVLNEGSGLELIRALRHRFPRLRILVFSMQDELMHAEGTLRAGADGYVHKCAEPRWFLEGLRQVAQGGRCISPAVAARLASQSDPRPAPLAGSLTEQELEILGMLGAGLTTGRIAQQLRLSSPAIRSHQEQMTQKLGLANTAHLLRFAVQRAHQAVRPALARSPGVATERGHSVRF